MSVRFSISGGRGKSSLGARGVTSGGLLGGLPLDWSGPRHSNARLQSPGPGYEEPSAVLIWEGQRRDHGGRGGRGMARRVKAAHDEHLLGVGGGARVRQSSNASKTRKKQGQKGNEKWRGGKQDGVAVISAATSKLEMCSEDQLRCGLLISEDKHLNKGRGSWRLTEPGWTANKKQSGYRFSRRAASRLCHLSGSPPKGPSAEELLRKDGGNRRHSHAAVHTGDHGD